MCRNLIQALRSILEALYRGQINPDEVIVPSQPEYRSVSRQVAAQTEQWRERLGEEVFRELGHVVVKASGGTIHGHPISN